MTEKDQNHKTRAIMVVGIIFILFSAYVSINIATTNSSTLSLSDAGLGFLGGEKDPFEDKDYYYSTAEEYVEENYEAPKQKNIEGLEDFLMQVELRSYEDDSVFTCTEISAMVEWLLEGAGFNTKIVLNYDLSAKTVEIKRKHSWVMVNTTDGLVAVESKKLTKDKYKPPGIITKPNGEYKEYSAYYRIYRDWKEKMERNITFDAWKKKTYEKSNTWNPKYYSPKEVKEDPHSSIEGDTRNGTIYKISKDQFNWFEVEPYKNSTVEFSNWS